MPLTHIVVLALIQGLTEFLPVSSSAHLIFPSQILGWPDQGLAFDVAVHVGTLLAVVFYYLPDLVSIAGGMVKSVIQRRSSAGSRIGWYIIIGTIPAGLCGILFESYISTVARSIEVIAWATIFFGLLLGFSSYINRKVYWRPAVSFNDSSRPDSLRRLTLFHAIGIGLAQALALIPGTSRSGITMTAGLLLGLQPAAAARFSFLLSIPIIAASGLLEGVKLVKSPELAAVDPVQMLTGAALSFVTAICVIHFFMKYIARSGMAVFVVYRLILGCALLYLVYA